MNRPWRWIAPCLTFALIAPLAAQDGKKKYKVNWPGKDLIKRDLRQLDLSDYNLEDADMTFTNLDDVKLIGTNLQGADLNFAHAAGANFTGADLRDSRITGAYLQAAVFDKANLSGLDLTRANFSGCKFRGADLRKLKGIGTISKADFTGADLRGANLLKATDNVGNSAIFRNAKYDAKTRWPLGFDIEASKAILDNEEQKDEKSGEKKRSSTALPPNTTDKGATGKWKVDQEVEAYNVLWHNATIVNIGRGEYDGYYYVHYDDFTNGQWIKADSIRTRTTTTPPGKDGAAGKDGVAESADEPRMGKYLINSYGPPPSVPIFLGHFLLETGGTYNAYLPSGKMTGEGNYSYDAAKKAVAWTSGPYKDQWGGEFTVEREGKTHKIRLRRTAVATNSTDAQK